MKWHLKWLLSGLLAVSFVVLPQFQTNLKASLSEVQKRARKTEMKRIRLTQVQIGRLDRAITSTNKAAAVVRGEVGGNVPGASDRFQQLTEQAEQLKERRGQLEERLQELQKAHKEGEQQRSVTNVVKGAQKTVLPPRIRF